MSSKSKSQLRTENSNNFPNNNSQFITPEKLRGFNNDIIDSLVVSSDTGSYVTTSSFDNGTRIQTFTKADGTTYTNSIPGGGGDTGSLLETASVVDAKPSTMFNGVLPNGSATAGEYALFAKDTTPAGVISTAVYYFDLESPHLGYSDWGMILQTGQNNNVTRYYLVPSSGSAPS